MKHQRLGNVTVGAQGFGAMGISEFYGPTDAIAAREALEHALELGVTYFDTADIYGFGANEAFLSDFVRANRERVVIGTKGGIVRRKDDPTSRRVDNSPQYLKKCVDASLRRLRVDALDLYMVHRKDEKYPVADTTAVLAEMVQDGKVLQIGWSEITGAELAEAHSVHPVAAVQTEWSLFSRDAEHLVAPTAAELGASVIAYAPLSRGLLSSQSHRGFQDTRCGMPRFTGDNYDANLALVRSVEAVAAKRGWTVAQVALAWVHSRADVHGVSVIPIPGTRSRERVAENVAAASLVLESDDLSTLEKLASRVAGDRYPDLSFTYLPRERATDNVRGEF